MVEICKICNLICLFIDNQDDLSVSDEVFQWDIDLVLCHVRFEKQQFITPQVNSYGASQYSYIPDG